MRSAKTMSELAPACADLYARPRCRAAYLATSPPESYGVRVLESCARDYCPELPQPLPVACAALTADGIRVDSVEQVFELWRELNPAIVALEHGAVTQARLARAARQSASVVRARAMDIGLALCETVAGTTLRVASGDAVPLAPEMVERLAALRERGASCAVREDASSASKSLRPVLVLSTLTGPQATPVDRLRVELRYEPEEDAFSVVSVTSASRETPESASLVYRMPGGSLVIVPQDPGSAEERSRTPDDRLRVEIRTDGVSLFAGRRPIGPGCVIDAAGTTFKSRPGEEDDLEALRRCAERLRREVPALRDAQEMDVRAGGEVPFGRLNRVSGALSADARGRPLFPKWNFALLR
jgi:hypothetical protein